MFVVATLLILRVSVEQASVVMKFAQFDASESPGSMFGQYEEILCGWKKPLPVSAPIPILFFASKVEWIHYPLVN